MATCKQCGNIVTGKKFCSECGAPASAGDIYAAAIKSCPRCNGEVKANAAFCMHCGASLAAKTPPPPPVTSYPPQPQPHYPQQYQQPQPHYPQQYQQPHYPQQYVPQVPMVLHCPTCMTISPAGITCCNGCGHSLVNIIPVPAHGHHNHHHHNHHNHHYRHDHHYNHHRRKHSGDLDFGDMAIGGVAGLAGGFLLAEGLDEIFDDD